MIMTGSPFVTTQWLANHIKDADLRIVDASWYLPQMKRDADAEFLVQHIPGAVRFDADAIADKSTNLPHMIANPQAFCEAVGALGISDSDQIVVYDGLGLFSAARVWWNFKIMGAKNVYVLSGGLPKWMQEDRSVKADYAQPEAAVFRGALRTDAVHAASDLLSLVTGDRVDDLQIVDVRPAARFLGEAPEPRPGLRQGHIPGSLNLPFSDLVASGQMIAPDAVKDRLKEAGIDTTKPLVATCGSGITAPILNLALAAIEVDAMGVYDGSWAEWGADAALPVINPSAE